MAHNKWQWICLWLQKFLRKVDFSWMWTLGSGEHKQLHGQPDPCDCHHLCQCPRHILLWVSLTSFFPFCSITFQIVTIAASILIKREHLVKQAELYGQYLSDFSLVNPMTWYKEEFPGVMAFTGNIMKGMGYTGDFSIWDHFLNLCLFWDKSL